MDYKWTLAQTKAAGGTQGHRNVPYSLKKQVWERYGYDQTLGPYEKFSNKYEIDHLIPNCLGGASDIENLWPEPYDGPFNAHMMDRLEKHIRGEVMAGRMHLKEAQQVFIPDWIKSYEKLMPPKATSEKDEDPEDDVQ